MSKELIVKENLLYDQYLYNEVQHPWSQVRTLYFLIPVISLRNALNKREQL